MVPEGIRDNQASVLDPASGRKIVSFETLKENYANIMLAFEDVA